MVTAYQAVRVGPQSTRNFKRSVSPIHLWLFKNPTGKPMCASTELVRENQPKLPVRLVQLSLRSQAGWNRSIPENER
jgi:hypothetical protein